MVRSLKTYLWPQEYLRADETSFPLFADDSKCFRLILGQDDGVNYRMIWIVLDWAHTRGKEFNYSKCKVLIITRKKTSFDREYLLGDRKLERVVVEKDLGVLITHNLSCMEQSYWLYLF